MPDRKQRFLSRKHECFIDVKRKKTLQIKRTQADDMIQMLSYLLRELKTVVFAEALLT